MEFQRNIIRTPLAAAVRAVTNVSDDQLNEHCRGVFLTINMAAVPGVDTVTFVIDGKDPVTGLYVPLLASAALVAAEVKATGNITLTGGAAGSINTAVVGGIALIAAPVPFNASLNQTATDLATAINARTSVHGYTANAAGAVVTITAPTGSGATVNGYVVTATLTTITATFGNMAAGASGTTVLRLYPGLVAAANLVANDVLPRSWRLRAVHSGVGNFTYSAVAQLIL
jgi:hypothetical protein